MKHLQFERVLKMSCNCWSTVAAIIAVIYGALYLFKKFMNGRHFSKDDVRIDGKVVIVTGCNTGIGKETALEMAKRGARVYMACRDWLKCEEARIEIVNATGNKKVFNIKLDLSSQESIREFVRLFLKEEKRLDILINNAAVVGERQLTVDGLEMQFAVNHLGPFLLTNLLLDTLKTSAPSRIVNVSSEGHRYGKIIRDDLMGEKSYSSMAAYCHTKLANILFTRELAKKLRGTKVTANSLHPGAVNTDILRNPSGLWWIVYPLMKTVFRTTKSGAQTSITCALDPELKDVTGKYFDDCRVRKESKEAQNDETADWLWRRSEKLTKFVK